ncbi:MAG: BamA/TamA family outer membrane protein [Ignavibacteria bacterium]|nr:BamA/TamA family outer membrane protein [Ignavibacteria bacterium]
MKNYIEILYFIVFFGFFLNIHQANAQDKIVLDSLLIKNTDSIVKKKVSINGYPYVFYTPETQLAFGAGGIVVFYTKSGDTILKPSKLGFGGYYSTTNQYKLSVNPALYFNENKLFISTPVSFGVFNDKFWGIGNDTQETGNEQYERENISASLIIQSPPILFSADRSGFIFDYDKTTITDKKENELLINDSIPGIKGGEIYGFGYDLTWDTRDNIFFPNKGGYQYFKLIVYPGFSDYNFGLFELDISHYYSFKKDHVFAFNLFVASTLGSAPFYKMPALGGLKRMRGYFNGRYRDNFYATIQVEYRQYFYKRFGFVAFGGLGDVSSELITFNFDALKYSLGGGLRYLFNKKQKINLRMDIAIGQDGNTGIYFGLEEAF